MPKISILAGTTGKSVDVFIQNSASTTGAGLTGLTFASSGLTAYYYREGAASSTAITLATMTLGTWATGGFIVMDATNMPGWYQLGLPNAAIAAGAKTCKVHLRGASNMADTPLEIELTAVDNQSATAFITGVNSLAPPTNWNLDSIDASGRRDVIKIAGTTQTARDIGASVLLSAGSGTGQLDFTSGVVKANLAQILGTALTETAGQLATAFKKFFDKGSPTGTINSIPDAVAGAAGGLFIAGTNAATTANITGNLTGNVTGSVGSVTGNVGGNLVGNVNGTVASVVGSVGSVTGNVNGSVASVAGSVSVNSNIKINQALANFSFMMTNSVTHAPATGATVTCTRRIDGGAYASGTLANITERGFGTYTVDFGAGDMNGKVLTLRATAPGCDDTFCVIITEP